MNGDDIHRYCANMFDVTGEQIDQLRQILSSLSSGTTTAATGTSISASPIPYAQMFGGLVLIVTLVMIFRDRNRERRSQDPTPQKQRSRGFDHNNPRDSDDDNTTL